MPERACGPVIVTLTDAASPAAVPHEPPIDVSGPRVVSGNAAGAPFTRAMSTDGGVRSPPRPSPQTLADDVSTTICRSPPPMTVRLATQGSGLAVPAAPPQSASTVAGAPPSDRNTKMLAGGFAPTKVASRVRTSCSGCCAVPFGAEMLTCCPSTESPSG